MSIAHVNTGLSGTPARACTKYDNSNAGVSGSGKTYASMLLLRQLFDVAGGGPETDAFKHLAAAFTVLRSLGSAKTSSNSESSRIVSALPCSTSTVHKPLCSIRLVCAGSFHRSASDRRRAVPDQDTLLLLGPDPSGTSAAERKELSHILPDARRSQPRGERLVVLFLLRSYGVSSLFMRLYGKRAFGGRAPATACLLLIVRSS